MAEFDYKRNSRVVDARLANGGALNQSMVPTPKPNGFDKMISSMTKKPLVSHGEHRLGTKGR